MGFESFVNSERYKTSPIAIDDYIGLRALLIQKDTKLKTVPCLLQLGLRALLIQKDTKREFLSC